MPQSYRLYVFTDGDVMFYVGITNNLNTRLWLHRRDSAVSGHRVYKRIRDLERAGRPHRVEVLAEYSDRHTATIAERDMIARIGLIEDGGTLLNAKRSSVRGDKAGYIEPAVRRMSQASKQWLADPKNADRNRAKLAAIHARDGYAEAQAAKQREIWDRPGEREARLAKQHSDEVQAKRKAEMQRRWADPVFREKMAQRRPKTWTDDERAKHSAMMCGNRFAARKPED